MQIDSWMAASLPLFLAALAGLALGGFFFGSLWWTVRRTLSAAPSASPVSTVLSHLGLLVLRLAVTLFGFYAVGAGQWERLLACLGGFLLARLAATWFTRAWERRQASQAAPNPMHPPHASSEAPHAPEP